MNAMFQDIHIAADSIGQDAVELSTYQDGIAHICRRRESMFSKRIRQVPATGHPSRFFDEIGINLANSSLSERSAPLKAIFQVVRYHDFRTDIDKQLEARDIGDAIEGVMHTHDVALWNGSDTSMKAPTSRSYFGALAQIAASRFNYRVGPDEPVLLSLIDRVNSMVEAGIRPTAIYSSPVLLDIIDKEMKKAFGVALPSKDLVPHFSVKTVSTSAGELPLIPDWNLRYQGNLSYGNCQFPVCIVTESLIEYHWLSDPNPRVFKSSVPSQYVVVKFGAIVVKNTAVGAHCRVTVTR